MLKYSIVPYSICENMQEAQLNVKLHKDLFQEIKLLSKVFHIPKNEWARSVLSHEVKKEVEEQKTVIIREYLKGTITKKELTGILGKKDVEDIEHITVVGRKSIEDAKRIAEQMR